MGGKRKNFRIQTWQVFLILIPLLFIAATLLRFDHIHMTELRDAVQAADEEGNEEKISATLAELKSFTFSHIVINIIEENGLQKITFGTGPFYLEHQYLRAATLALEKAEASLSGDSNPNGNVYLAARQVCEPQAKRYGWAWNSSNFINCMTSEIAKYPSASNITDTIVADIPSTELYRYNYASPLWAPTLSGFVIMFCLILILFILVRIFLWTVLRLSLFFLKS